MKRRKLMKQMGRKVLGAVLACALSVTMLPAVGGEAIKAEAAVVKTTANTSLGANSITNIEPGHFNVITYGMADGREELLFNVLSKTKCQSGFTVSTPCLLIDCKMPVWENSHRSTYDVNYYFRTASVEQAHFSPLESRVIQEIDDGYHGWDYCLLSKSDINEFYGNNSQAMIKSYNGIKRDWWLRDTYGTDYGYYVNTNGSVYSDKKNTQVIGFTPSMNIPLNKILFSTKVGQADSTHGMYKLTLLDKYDSDKRKITTKTIGRCQGKIKFSYEVDANYKYNNYSRMSLIITNKQILGDKYLADMSNTKLYEYVNLGKYENAKGEITYELPFDLKNKTYGKDYFVYFTIEGEPDGSDNGSSYFAAFPSQVNVPDTDAHVFGEPYWRVSAPASCERAGNKHEYHDCLICGEHVRTGNRDSIPRLGHDYADPVYEWSADGKTCTASRTCKRDKCGKVEKEEGLVSSKVKTPASIGKKGTTTYTAEFTNKIFKTQTIDIEDIPALDKDGKPIIEPGEETKPGEEGKSGEAGKPTEEAKKVEDAAPVTEADVDGAHYKVDGENASLESTKDVSGDFTVPGTVKIGDKDYPVNKIGPSAFKNTEITSLAVEGEVTEIGDSAFEGCKKLKKVTIGANITKIGKKAFFKCSNLKKVTFKGTKVKSIGAKAFKKIKKGATFKTPKKKLKAYTKLLKKKTDAGVKIKK
ncbi:leucine-rich repeat domain-containing protein [Butyrivibrio sp. AD3002]|uniref:leucine-rich repeat domain-containing protein n=1 Tax=Butyrivibrio sp. AD3002 TaxID=1280670 RepID=UPI0003B703A2|nr:leucine-rich repeat domain-containing protein [Butyrivibrio sp. AD3002]